MKKSSVGFIFVFCLVVALSFLKNKNNGQHYFPKDAIAVENLKSESLQEIQIESKGLAEFNPENNTINTVTPVDKQLAEEMGPGFKAIGDGKDVKKNEEAISFLDHLTLLYKKNSVLSTLLAL